MNPKAIAKAAKAAKALKAKQAYKYGAKGIKKAFREEYKKSAYNSVLGKPYIKYKRTTGKLLSFLTPTPKLTKIKSKVLSTPIKGATSFGTGKIVSKAVDAEAKRNVRIMYQVSPKAFKLRKLRKEALRNLKQDIMRNS